MKRRCLVAYGNELRGDDGLAWELARRAAEEGWTVFTRVQLLPELIEELQAFEEVVFADACEDSEPLWFEINLLGLRDWPVHCGRPDQLLSLCRQLFGRAPRAWMLTLPGSDFGYHLGLSPAGLASVERGLEWLRTHGPA